MSDAQKATATPENHVFQAEVAKLLKIVASALYSHSEIFLRELISNAADACDRLRYAALTEPKLLGEAPELEIRLAVDRRAGTLTIADNGIGMGREELIDNLGTIARSGTSAFVESLGDKAEASALIGQFGVGFYSSFMVADEVTVESRKAGQDEAWSWRSDGSGSFTVGALDGDAPLRGTRVVLKLKEDCKEFLEPHRLEQIVKTYSDHIAQPILLEGSKEDEEARRLNQASALWALPPSEVEEGQYLSFYREAAHAVDEPWATLHFRVEGTLAYAGLIFIPGERPWDLLQPERKARLKLYVRRVFITDDCEELIPAYLRFLRGVVDTEDLPLNVSREMLQKNAVVRKIRQGLVKRVLGELAKRAEKDPEGYLGFWEAFGPVLKEGLYEDAEQREALLKLARFRSSGVEGWTSLADYLGRAKEDQKAIYTLAGDELERLKKSPQLEGFKAAGVEVLYLTDPVDEFWVAMVGEFEGKPFRSVTRAGDDLEELAETPAETAEESGRQGGLVAYLKLTLKDAVKDVRSSRRLTDSPVCLVADESDMDIHLERMLMRHGQLEQASKRVLEVNPKHTCIARLAERIAKLPVGKAGTAAPELEDAAWLLLDQARILEGEAPLDPAAFARRFADALGRGLAAPGGEAAAEKAAAE